MTMLILNWNAMNSSSMHLTHLSRCPGRMWYCLSSKNMQSSCGLGPRTAVRRTKGTPRLDALECMIRPVIGNLLALSPTTLPDTPPLEYVDAAASAGYDAVGLRLNRSPLFPFHPVAGNASLVRELKRALARSCLGVLDILSFYLQPVTNIEAFAAPLELGAELGARYALVAGDDADGSRLRDNLARFCNLARPFGVTAAVEFAAIRPLATLGQTLRLLADAGRENAVVCLDPLNHIRGGGTVAELRAVDRRLFPTRRSPTACWARGSPIRESSDAWAPTSVACPAKGRSRCTRSSTPCRPGFRSASSCRCRRANDDRHASGRARRRTARAGSSTLTPAAERQGYREAFAETSNSFSHKGQVSHQLPIQYDRSRVRRSVRTVPPSRLLSSLTFWTRFSI